MEEVLDLIAAGESDRVVQLAAFWRGGESVAGPFPGIKALTEDLEAIDARQIATTPIAGSDAFLRVGRYGAYVERGEERANIPVGLAPDELTAEKAEALLAEPSGDRDLGIDPETGLQVLAKTGRYGPYVTEVLAEGSPKSAKPRTGSLLTDMTLDTVTLDDALRLLNLPRVVGTDPNTEEVITSQNGRYGPYLMRGKDSRSLASEAEIFTVNLEQALALYAQPKVRRGRGQAAPPLREVGNDPTTGNAMVIREGRFGPYVTDGETNASLRTADDPATISVERASDLLSERRAKDASEGKSPAKKTARKAVKRPPSTTKRTVTAKSSAAKRAATATGAAKAPAKKTAAKKAAAKKTAAKKPAAKKTAAKKAVAKKAPAKAPSIAAAPSPVAAGSR
jgi:DNA topoisomerase-1